MLAMIRSNLCLSFSLPVYVVIKSIPALSQCEDLHAADGGKPKRTRAHRAESDSCSQLEESVHSSQII